MKSISWLHKDVLHVQSFYVRQFLHLLISMFWSRNYLFSARTLPLSLISAPAPAIYCHLKLFYYIGRYHTNEGRNEFFFSLASSKLTAVRIY